jgi:hypothetical protein
MYLLISKINVKVNVLTWWNLVYEIDYKRDYRLIARGIILLMIIYVYIANYSTMKEWSWKD